MRRDLLQAIDDGKTPDAVIMLSLSEKIVLTPVLARRACRVFWLEHDRIGRWLKWNPWLPLLWRASRMATTICVSELSKRLYLSLGWSEQHTVAIPNGIDLDRFGAPRNDCKDEKSLHIGCVARLTPDKGVDVLIDAMEGLKHAKLSVIGKGPELAHLRELADKKNVSAVFAQKHDDLGAFYRSIDLLVLPSREHDPFGLVAAEAMTIGTPVITTDACGIADYLTNESATVVKANNAQALCEAIKSYSDADTRVRIGKAGAKLAREQFGVERMVERYVELLAAKA